MKTVMVTKFAPMPANGGGRQRSLALVKRLAEMGEVTLCAYDDGGIDRRGLERLGVRLELAPWPPPRREVVRALGRTGSISTARFYSKALHACVLRAGEGSPVDLLQVEYAQLAPALDWIPARLAVIDFHNVESNLAMSYAKARSALRSLPYRAESWSLGRVERRAVQAADISVVVSDIEARRLRGGSRAALVCPNGWEPGPALAPSNEPTVIFVAVLGWPPNAQAARWLLAKVWPLVRRRVPDATLLLVGKDPPADLRSDVGNGVAVVGSVPDVRPFLARARVSVAPLLAGGGTRLKILESLDAGRPVVATRVAAEGLDDLCSDGLVLADSAEEIADELAALLLDPDLAARLGAAGNVAIAQRHSWDEALSPLLRLLRS